MVVNHTGNAARINETWHYQKSSPPHSGRITKCNQEELQGLGLRGENEVPETPCSACYLLKSG